MRIAAPTASAPPRRGARAFDRDGRTAVLLALATALILAAVPARAAIISRTITVDGTFSDWDPNPPGTPCPSGNITCNPGQFSTDPNDNPSPTGRDLRAFAFTFDTATTNPTGTAYLYMYVERFASTNNRTDWWFYIDADNDATMDVGEKVLHVQWTGSNRRTRSELYDYDPVDDVNGDSLTDPNTGSANDYDMPGDLVDEVDLEDVTGGSSSGLEMETRVAWEDIVGVNAPQSIGFYIASSNGTNIPNNIIDSMDGPANPGGGGSGLTFSDPFVTKTGPATGLSGLPVAFEVVVGNNGPDGAFGLRIRDDCEALTGNRALDPAPPANESYAYHSHSIAVSGGVDPLDVAYTPVDDAGTTGIDEKGLLAIDELPANETVTLTLNCLALLWDPVEVTNTADIVDFANPDTDTSAASNSASNPAPVIVVPLPDIVMLKTSTVEEDPVNGTTNPKRIPGAIVEYTVEVDNVGRGNAEDLILTDLLPPGLSLFVGDFDGNGNPVALTSGPGPAPLTLDAVTVTPAPAPGDDYASATSLLVDIGGTVFGASDEETQGTDLVSEFTLRFRARID
jgi:uncharacterized repeat protein (TIGR01451 family)